MGEQVQKEKQQSTTKVEHAPTEAKDLRNEELSQEVEDLLDEIDGLLEENAQEFVASFIQKGGQ